MHLAEYACLIYVTNPSPLTTPLLGDGTNQFLYDAAAPGNLIVPGVISVPGASAQDTDWLLTKDLNYNSGSAADIKMDAPLQATLYGGIQEASAGQIKSVYGLSAPYADGLWFQGLPSANSGFGSHLATLKVEGHDSQQARLQTFFLGVDGSGNYAANYPTASTNKAPDGSVIPNWYYYYNQVYAAPGNYDSVATSSYTDAHTAQFPIHIANDAYGLSYIRVFDLNPVAPHYIRYIGNLDISGIHKFIYVCAHEAGHQTLSVQGGVYNFSPDPTQTPPITTDSDNVSDGWEIDHHLNSAVPDTAGAYGVQSNGDVGDNEVLADVQALPVIFQQGATWKQDWANGGLQWGANTYSTGNPTSFYWVFHALVNGTTFVSGTAYNVRALADLTSQYPSLLTSIP